MLHLPEGSTKERGTPGTPGTFVLVCVFVYVYVWVSQVALALKNQHGCLLPAAALGLGLGGLLRVTTPGLGRKVASPGSP